MSDDLRGDDLVRRVAAIDAIAARATASADEVAGLVACLGDAHKPVQRRAADALAVLQRAGTDVVAAVRGALSASALRHRWGAAYALGRLDAATVEVVPILLDVLGSDDGDRRWAAAQMLVGFAHDERVVDALRARLRDDDPTTRKMALYCLRDVGRPWDGGDAAVRDALRDPDPAVRLAALATAPALAVDRGAIATACAGCVDDPVAGVGRAALAALGRLGCATPEIGVVLDRAATSSDPARVRAARAARARLFG